MFLFIVFCCNGLVLIVFKITRSKRKLVTENETNQTNVQGFFNVHPIASIRDAEMTMEVSYSYCQRILKTERMLNLNLQDKGPQIHRRKNAIRGLLSPYRLRRKL